MLFLLWFIPHVSKSRRLHREQKCETLIARKYPFNETSEMIYVADDVLHQSVCVCVCVLRGMCWWWQVDMKNDLKEFPLCFIFPYHITQLFVNHLVSFESEKFLPLLMEHNESKELNNFFRSYECFLVAIEN